MLNLHILVRKTLKIICEIKSKIKPSNCFYNLGNGFKLVKPYIFFHAAVYICFLMSQYT